MNSENSKASGSGWFLTGIITGGVIVFAAFYFHAPKIMVGREIVTNTITNTLAVTNTVTNTVEVPKEVQKLVTVPAEIPQQYIDAVRTISNYDNCAFVRQNEVLFGMKDVQVKVFMDDNNIKDTISEDAVRAKFELTLRKNNVPINPTSRNSVYVVLNAIWQQAATQTTIVYDLEVKVAETQTLLRGGEMRKAVVRVWIQGDYGIVGKDKAEKAVLDDVEKYAEVFANDYLSANPKPR